jgi:hypothetical protein
LNDVQIDSYAGNTKAGKVARVDAVGFVRVANSRLKTRRDARSCRHGGAETALLNISSRVPTSGLKKSRRTHTAVPQTDIGSIIISFNERAGLSVVIRSGNGGTESDGEECC